MNGKVITRHIQCGGIVQGRDQIERLWGDKPCKDMECSHRTNCRRCVDKHPICPPCGVVLLSKDTYLTPMN